VDVAISTLDTLYARLRLRHKGVLEKEFEEFIKKI